jgi:hypothetical protein
MTPSWRWGRQSFVRGSCDPTLIVLGALTLASTIPGSVGGSDPAERAVHALRVCVAFGFDNAHKVRTDARLAPLRRRPDFEKLARDLEARIREKQPS